jgi:hypothetical protein
MNKLRQVEIEFAQECMDSTVYEINLDKLKENSHKSAWIVLCIDKLKENSHKSACLVLCMR